MGEHEFEFFWKYAGISWGCIYLFMSCLGGVFMAFRIGFLRRPVWRGPGVAGLRLRSGAFAPDYPVVILVLAFGDSFGFPRAHLHAPPPQAHATPGSFSFSFTRAGAAGVLKVLASTRLGEERLAGPAPGRPRWRPLGAYAVSCVGAVTLRGWRRCWRALQRLPGFGRLCVARPWSAARAASGALAVSCDW